MSNAEIKTERVMAALEHREADRVPVGEFFWANFLRRVNAGIDSTAPFDPHRHWDLDLIVINPNMDPRIHGVELLEDTAQRKIVKTGFGATIERRRDCPMPIYTDFEFKTFEQFEAFDFDDPNDRRRYFEAIDSQLNSVKDDLVLNQPSFVDCVNACADDFCVFGGVCEPHEMIWRMMGCENVLMKMGEDPDRVGRCIERLGDFAVGMVQGQIAAAGNKIKGLYIWGDVASTRGMLFSPIYWRKVYKPQLRRICDAAHAAGLKTVYHGCGNASAVFDDMIDAGVDCYNPLEAKAGLDVVDLKRRFGRRWAFCGNIDIRVLESNDLAKVRREVLTKLNAAKGGGYIIQSDHSISGNVSPKTYNYMIQLVREYGQYPLSLGSFDEKV
jgi:uroporphyrinogen decarboxylase